MIRWPFKRPIPVDIREALYRLQTRTGSKRKPYPLTDEERARIKRQVYARLGLGEP